MPVAHDHGLFAGGGGDLAAAASVAASSVLAPCRIVVARDSQTLCHRLGGDLPGGGGGGCDNIISLVVILLAGQLMV